MTGAFEMKLKLTIFRSISVLL